MFLTYGRDEQDSLVHISEARGGKNCGLACPFCGISLVARQGRLVAHHFAHQRDTCRPAIAEAGDIIPSYDGFVMGLSKREHQVLTKVINGYSYEAGRTGMSREYLSRLAYKRFIFLATAPHDRTNWFIKAAPKARAVARHLSLVDFAALIRDEFQRSGLRLWRKDVAEQQVAREILEREVERANRTALYFLKFETDGDPIYKIGITTRPLEERIGEVQSFVRQHATIRKTETLFHLPRLGYVEGYFKARFADHRLEIGQATEYFRFQDPELIERIMAELKTLRRNGQGIQLAEAILPTVAAGDPPRPRFQARFQEYTVRWNPFKRTWEIIQAFGDVTNIDTGERFGQQTFTLGKRFETRGPLSRFEVVQFSAVAQHCTLKNPTNITIIRGSNA